MIGLRHRMTTVGKQYWSETMSDANRPRPTSANFERAMANLVQSTASMAATTVVFGSRCNLTSEAVAEVTDQCLAALDKLLAQLLEQETVGLSGILRVSREVSTDGQPSNAQRFRFAVEDVLDLCKQCVRTVVLQAIGASTDIWEAAVVAMRAQTSETIARWKADLFPQSTVQDTTTVDC